MIDNRSKCVKQVVVAVIKTVDGDVFTGSNWCAKPQKECPRKGMPSGQGYEICERICGQVNHAEVDAVMEALRTVNGNLNGATCYVIGHSYACDKCKKVLAEVGITDIRVCN